MGLVPALRRHGCHRPLRSGGLRRGPAGFAAAAPLQHCAVLLLQGGLPSRPNSELPLGRPHGHLHREVMQEWRWSGVGGPWARNALPLAAARRGTAFNVGLTTALAANGLPGRRFAVALCTVVAVGLQLGFSRLRLYSFRCSPPSIATSLLLRHFPSPPAFVRPPSSRGPSQHSAYAPDTRPPGVSLERYLFYFADWRQRRPPEQKKR